MDNIKKYAELFNLVSNSFDGAKFGKKVAQKMFYFFERMGINLNLRYGIYYYGPYSSKLDNMLHVLESEEYIKINTDGTTHIISIGKKKSNSALSHEEKDIATTVIESFAHKTPLELEALATMDYVANSMNCTTKEAIVSTFKAIKGDKFNLKTINETYSTLKQLNLISA